MVSRVFRYCAAQIQIISFAGCAASYLDKSRGECFLHDNSCMQDMFSSAKIYTLSVTVYLDSLFQGSFWGIFFLIFTSIAFFV